MILLLCRRKVRPFIIHHWSQLEIKYKNNVSSNVDLKIQIINPISLFLVSENCFCINDCAFICMCNYNSSFSPLFGSSLDRVRPIISNRLAEEWPRRKRERGESFNNYTTSKIRIWSIFSEVVGSWHIHRALPNPLKRKSLCSSFFELKNLSSCWLWREMWIREWRQMGFYQLKVRGKRRLDDFFNLGHIMFAHSSLL